MLFLPLPSVNARAQGAIHCVSSEATFTFGDEISGEQRDSIRRALEVGINYVCLKADVGVEGLAVFAFGDLEALIGAYAKWFGVPLDQAREAWASGRSAISGPNALFLYTGNPGLSSVLQSSDQRSLVELLSQEYFHVVQWKLASQNLIGRPDNEVPMGGPRWLIEGAATFVGSLSVDYSGLYSFGLDKEEKRRTAIFTTPALSSMETLKGLAAVGDAGYELAFIASDFLIPDSETRPSGVRSLVGFWEAIGKGTTWREAFQSAFGKSIDDFYQRFEDTRSRSFPPILNLPFAIAFDGTFPSGADVDQGAPPDHIPYLFRVAGFDISSLAPDQISAAFERPPDTTWGLTRLGRDSVVLYMKPDAMSGTYNVALGLPDGRHSETTFKHIATSGSGVANPVPSLTALVPSQHQAGDAGFVLTITGNDFVNGAIARWNGLKRLTKRRSSTQLEVALTGADVDRASTASIEVVNPVPAGGVSNAQSVLITQAAPSGPRITGASISGKKLIVNGVGFDDGAKILVNGEQQKTANDDQNPTTALIAKKAGKNITPGQTVTLQIRNSDGTLSSLFTFTRTP